MYNKISLEIYADQLFLLRIGFCIQWFIIEFKFDIYTLVIKYLLIHIIVTVDIYNTAERFSRFSLLVFYTRISEA